MLLLNARTLHLEDIPDPSTVKYAILSHTWGSDEVSFEDLKHFPRAKRQAGFAKIARTCELALQHKLDYAWVDTCCINKASSAELSEAINSMFAWYQQATVCFVWLEDLAPVHKTTWSSPSPENLTSSGDRKLYDISEVGSCKWFSRGWTLQELIAPREVKFYDTDWNLRFTKTERTADLSRITDIDEDVLGMQRQLKDVLVGVRMSWAAARETTRPEDLAYCLLGIFGINMPMLYGEGRKAFERLQEHIASQHRDDSLFAWQARSTPDQVYRGVFARSPEEFKACSKVRLASRFMFSSPGYSLTNKGIKFSTASLKVDNDTYFVMRLGIQCNNCDDSHDIHICLLRTTKGHIRVAPHRCWRPPAGGGGLRPFTKIYCRKDVTIDESQALERMAPSPLRLLLDMDRSHVLSVAQYPELAWDATCNGFCGDALADDFSGFIQVQAKVLDALDLTLVVHKLAKEDEPDVELYAQPRDLRGPWTVTEGYTCDDLYQGRRLDGDRLLGDYRMAKLHHNYQPKRTVKLERRSPPGNPPKTVAFEARVDGLHITVSLVVKNGSSPPVIQDLPVVQTPVFPGSFSFRYPYGYQGPPESEDTEDEGDQDDEDRGDGYQDDEDEYDGDENGEDEDDGDEGDGDQDDGEDCDENEDPGNDDVRNLSLAIVISYADPYLHPSSTQSPTADPRFTPTIPTSSGNNTSEPDSQDFHSPYDCGLQAEPPSRCRQTRQTCQFRRFDPTLRSSGSLQDIRADEANRNNTGG